MSPTKHTSYQSQLHPISWLLAVMAYIATFMETILNIMQRLILSGRLLWIPHKRLKSLHILWKCIKTCICMWELCLLMSETWLHFLITGLCM